jgi:hypothetical protein
METFGEQTFPFVSETGNWIFQFPAAKDAIHPRCKQREILADFVKPWDSRLARLRQILSTARPKPKKT